MVTITGGKLTTWRRMAKMAVDRLVEREAREAPCRTHEIPLGQAVEADDLPRVEGVPPEAYERAGRPLRPRGPRRARASPPSAASSRSRSSGRPGPATCSPRPCYAARTRAGARRSATCCCGARAWGCSPRARSATRRSDVALRVAQAMAPELGWDAERTEREARAFLEEAAAEGIVAHDSTAAYPVG